MDIIFEYDDVTASKRLETIATEKLNNLAQKYEMLIRADVFFKRENTSSNQTGLICNIRLSLPGPRIFAEANHDNFENAIAESVSDLEKQLAKKKGKLKKH